jgi:hypothetical protein
MKVEAPERATSKLHTPLDPQQPGSADDLAKQVKDELSLSRQRVLQGSINSKTSNKSIEIMRHQNSSPSRMVLIDMHQGKSIFNSGVNKIDA